MPLRDLLILAAPYRMQLALLGLLSILASAVTLAIPALGGQFMGSVFDGGGQSPARVALLLCAAVIAVAIVNFLSALFSGRTAIRLLGDLRRQVYAHVQSLPIGYHEHHRQGDTLALMTYEVASLSAFLTSTLTSIPSRLLTAVGAVILMFRIDPLLASLVPLAIPAFFVLMKLIGRNLRPLAERIQRAEAEVVAIAEENLEMLPAIKAFTREPMESGRYGEAVDHAKGLALRQNRIQAALGPALELLASIASIALLVFASASIRDGGMSAADLFSFLLYAALLTRPVGALARTYGLVQTARGTLARLHEVLQTPTEPAGNEEAAFGPASGSIRVSSVSFGYPGRGIVLDDVDLEVAAGDIVALVGDNGAGKTTLVNLLLRFYEVQSGEIALDGRDIRTIRPADLRRQFGLVPQRPLLFNGTVRANIAFGLDGADDEAIAAAARLAQAHEFIAALPQGYETRIGDHGARLSGGQRQRIALARALLKDPPILIFDEATSMFDIDGEHAFIASCESALEGRTVILITHRPASLALARRIIRVEGGKLHEETARQSDGGDVAAIAG